MMTVTYQAPCLQDFADQSVAWIVLIWNPECTCHIAGHLAHSQRSKKAEDQEGRATNQKQIPGTIVMAQNYLSVCHLFNICMPMCDFRVTVPFLRKVNDLSSHSLGPFTGAGCS